MAPLQDSHFQFALRSERNLVVHTRVLRVRELFCAFADCWWVPLHTGDSLMVLQELMRMSIR